MSSLRQWNLGLRSCLSLIKLSQNDPLAESIYPDTKELQVMVAKMNDNNLLSIPILETADLTSIKAEIPSDDKPYGRLLKIIRVSEHHYIAYGWAYLHNKNEPAHAIFLTYNENKGRPVLFKYVIDPYMTDLIISRTTKNEPIIMKNWKIIFKRRDIPEIKAEINAWAFDAILGKIYLLDQSLTIDFTK
jgi:hypothetical protein